MHEDVDLGVCVNSVAGIKCDKPATQHLQITMVLFDPETRETIAEVHCSHVCEHCSNLLMYGGHLAAGN